MSQNSKNYKNKYFYKGSFYDLYHLFNKLVDDGIVVIYPGSPFIWLDLKGKSHYTRGGKSDLVNALMSAGIVMQADDVALNCRMDDYKPEEAKCETCPRTETCEAIEQTYLEIPHPEDLPMMEFETVE